MDRQQILNNLRRRIEQGKFSTITLSDIAFAVTNMPEEELGIMLKMLIREFLKIITETEGYHKEGRLWK